MSQQASFSNAQKTIQSLLQANGITRLNNEQMLLHDVSLTVKGGDRIAVVGPTGSGKSLLLRSLARLDPIDAGEILWRGCSVSAREIPRFRSQIIYLHQRPSLGEGSVEDSLQHPFSFTVHQKRSFNRDRLVDQLRWLGRDESFLSKQNRDLSGGETQLMALLRAIQLDPEVLLLDEPTSALDANSAKLVEGLVSRWLEESSNDRAILWVTHDAEQAARISTSIIQLIAGKTH